ncbi:MAG: 1-acyl-sn-glycerol-3-phosphate acyltransferase [Ferruginibacter sp.]|nr:1-acyl-sn-glycerol-3-phosphate acyltransferase [Ferruginibacter sp.]
MVNPFILTYNYFKRRRSVFFVLFTACFLVVGFFALKVNFEEDISKVLPKDKKIEKLNQVFQNSKFLDKLVIMVSLKDTVTEQPDSLVAFADIFTEQVQSVLGSYITKINARVDDNLVTDLFNNITERLPIYLNENDYKTIDTLVEAGRVKETLAQNIRTLTSPAGIALKNIISTDPVGISFIGLKKLQQLQYDENFELYDSYVMTKDHRNLLFFLTPKYAPNNTGKNALFLKGLDSIIGKNKHTGWENIEASYFGATAVSLGNAVQLRKDTTLTQGCIVVFLILFLGFYFRRKRAPIVILIPVIFGALFSLAAIYFIKGSISIIALGTGSVILGIAVNYSLHVYNHYRHTGNIETVIKDLTMPLTVGSFTTIGGFLCLQFVESEVLKDLGLFAAFSLIGASISSLLFLPHFIQSKKDRAGQTGKQFSWIDKIASYRPEYNKYIIAGIFLLTILFAYTARNVSFESDMLNMNFMSANLRQAENKLNKINEYALKSVYLVTEGKTLNEALINNEKLATGIEALKEKNIVKKYSGVSSLVISDSLQRSRIARWNQYWTPEKKQQLMATLEKEGAVAGFKPTAFDKFKDLLNKNYEPADQQAMATVRKSFLDDFITEKPGKVTVVTLVKVAAENTEAVYHAFENDANITVVDKQYLTSRFVEIINADFTSIALMTSILVFVVLLIMYGRIELTLVSFIPMLISWIWILGLMSIFDIRFNIVNIIISALIFGLGDDYSLFIMDGLLQEYKTGKKNLASFKSSIFLSAITTVAGLGVLIFAKHPALKSIAVISIIGIVCVVIMSQILIPFFFNLLIKKRTQKKQFPWTFSGFIISAFAFAYFIFGCLLLVLIGVLLKLSPFNREKTKYLYHVILCRFTWSMMYIMPNVKKKVINLLKEDFSKPAVIICNHQSFLDILCVVMLTPKLILFTNKWVWNSPFFGAVVRMADFYPISQGAEVSIDLLEKKVQQGYSIMVFPEGTRSVDGVMKRFHKGAFFLAEKLNIDILPIVLHGTGYTMSKSDFLLKNGNISIKFLPRITPQNISFGNGYAERTRFVGKYFREELQALNAQIAQTAYFRERLKYNYIYKGPMLEWYMKIKTRMEKNYQAFHDLLPQHGNILDIGCGNGFLCYMLNFAAPERMVMGIDYDEGKIDTAKNCFSKNSSINFEVADITNYIFGYYDGMVLADILHYLPAAQQKFVIENCIHHLNPGGTIIIRDGNKDLAERHKGTKLTEFISTKFMGFNKTTADGLSFLSGKMIHQVADDLKMECREIDDTKYTSNIVFVLKHKEKEKYAAGI